MLIVLSKPESAKNSKKFSFGKFESNQGTNYGIITYYYTSRKMRFGFLFSIVLLFTLLAVAESKKITADECKGRN